MAASPSRIISCQLPASLVREVDVVAANKQVATDHRISRSEMIRELIEAGLRANGTAGQVRRGRNRVRPAQAQG